MELSNRQKILLFALGGVALLLLAGLVFWIVTSDSGDRIPAEPQVPSVAPTELPSTLAPSETPTLAPTGTPYRLPLVPQGGTGATPAPTETPTPSDEAEAAKALPAIKTDAREGTYRADQREFLAIGTQNGEAIAVLLVQVKPPKTTVIAIPCETLAPVYTLDASCTVTSVDPAPVGTASTRAQGEREGCWNLIWAVKNLTGYQAPEYLCVDFGCMEAFFAFAPKLETASGTITLETFRAALNEADGARALAMGELGVGAVQYLREVSLWELPGFRSATRDAFSSSLSVFELLSLMRALRTVTDFTVGVLPTERSGDVLILSDASIPF